MSENYKKEELNDNVLSEQLTENWEASDFGSAIGYLEQYLMADLEALRSVNAEIKYMEDKIDQEENPDNRKILENEKIEIEEMKEFSLSSIQTQEKELVEKFDEKIKTSKKEEVSELKKEKEKALKKIEDFKKASVENLEEDIKDIIKAEAEIKKIKEEEE